MLGPDVAAILEASQANPDDQRGFRRYAAGENKEKRLSVLQKACKKNFNI